MSCIEYNSLYLVIQLKAWGRVGDGLAGLSGNTTDIQLDTTCRRRSTSPLFLELYRCMQPKVAYNTTRNTVPGTQLKYPSVYVK